MAPIPEHVGSGPYPEAQQRWIKNEVGKWMLKCLERTRDSFRFVGPNLIRISAFIIDGECVHPVISSARGTEYHTLGGEQFSKVFPVKAWSEHEGKYCFNVEWQEGLPPQRYPYYSCGRLEVSEDKMLTISQNRKGIFLLPEGRGRQPGYYYLPSECYLPLWEGLKRGAGVK